MNEAVSRCTDLHGVATEAGRDGTAVRRYLFGERWTDKQEHSYRAAIASIGESRRKLAAQLRVENREKPVNDPLG